MQSDAIETDYLVVRAGAAAMAFVDTLLSETDARVLMVDRRHKPGGHWNDAYPFVGLHQPAAFYGVASRELSEWKKDETGLNAGFYSLSTGAEVLNHFEQVMRQRFLPSGRVVFHPMTEYSEETRVASPDLADEWRDALRANTLDGGRDACANGDTFDPPAQV